jgi:predicted XRE-type DNA-binding protein
MRTKESLVTRTRTRQYEDAWAAMDLPADEAWHLRVRSRLMVELSRIIQQRRLTQVQAAKLFGVSQPRVSDLIRGKIDRFSIDSLVRMLGVAGAPVRITVGKATSAA